MTSRDTTVGEMRELASKVLQHVTLRDISLASLAVRGAIPLLSGPFDVEQEVSVKGEQLAGRNAVQAWAKYEVTATRHREDQPVKQSGSADPAWAVTCEIVADYPGDADSLPEFKAEELNAFALLVGLMAIHPYARETVQSMTGRLGYPPFTLEMLTPISGQADDVVIEMSEAVEAEQDA
jgi:hypothetical protein